MWPRLRLALQVLGGLAVIPLRDHEAALRRAAADHADELLTQRLSIEAAQVDRLHAMTQGLAQEFVKALPDLVQRWASMPPEQRRQIGTLPSNYAGARWQDRAVVPLAEPDEVALRSAVRV